MTKQEAIEQFNKEAQEVEYNHAVHAEKVVDHLNAIIESKPPRNPHIMATFVICFHDTLKEALQLLIAKERGKV